MGNYLLTTCAQMTTGSKARIDFGAVRGALNDPRPEVKLLAWGITDVMNQVLKRQATLKAIHDSAQSAAIIAHFGAVGFLAAAGTDIRSSHAGAPIDPKLPQGPYVAAPPGAMGNVRGQANWEWLQNSTTEHTTFLFKPPDPNRVASYFEMTLETITDNQGVDQLRGGRIVYDPFNHRFFISEHYADQFELTNIPAVQADASYAAVMADIALQAAVPAPAWGPFFDTLAARMHKGEI